VGERRRSRDARPEPKAFRLGERDIRIMQGLARMKLARTTMLQRLYFGDRSTASRRLAKLVALKLANVFVPHLNSENVYGLSERGRVVLLERGVDDNEIHVGRSIRRADLEHLLAINEVRVALVRGCRGSNITIDFFRSDSDLRRLAGLTPPSYLPDALVRLRSGSVTTGLVIEVDTGSEGSRYFLSRKVEPLASIAASSGDVWGLRPWRPILVTLTTGRLRRLAGVLATHGGSQIWLGTTVELLNRLGPTGLVAVTLSEAANAPTDGDLVPRHPIFVPAKVP